MHFSKMYFLSKILIEKFPQVTSILDYYNVQISKMEEDIIKYQTSGRSRSIELIKPKLNKYKEVRDSLKNEIGIFGMPKYKREYIGEERKIDG
ncbi:hypothetical protein [Bacillus mycoides]|uniref:hypothetical protein n=1 Tax=Bacillus mycoides TaxID=1405 RepID=UPI003D237E53